MAGRIARIFRNVEELSDGSANPDFVEGAPIFWLEYLCQDDEQGQRFSTSKGEALVFPSHGLADEHAAKLRADSPLLGFLFAISCPAVAISPPPPSSGYSRSPARSRRDRIEEEMRADDLAQLEREEIYG